MKYLIALVLCLCLISTCAFAEDKDKHVIHTPPQASNESIAGSSVLEVDGSKIGSLTGIKEGWVIMVSGNTATATNAIFDIKSDTPPNIREEKIKTAVMAVQNMKEEGKKQGIIVDGFSIGFPASFSVNFRFSDKE